MTSPSDKSRRQCIPGEEIHALEVPGASNRQIYKYLTVKVCLNKQHHPSRTNFFTMLRWGLTINNMGICVFTLFSRNEEKYSQTPAIFILFVNYPLVEFKK